MRSDGVLRVILNARIQPQMPLHVRNEKYLEFYAPESEKMVKFLCKCKNGEVARRFEKTVKACLPPPKRRIEGDGSSDEEKNEKRVKVNPKTAKEPTTGKEAPVKSTSKVDAKNIPKLDDKSKFNDSNNLKSVDKEEEAKTKVKFDSKDQLKPKATGTGTGDSKASPERKEMLVTPEKVGKVEKK